MKKNFSNLIMVVLFLGSSCISYGQLLNNISKKIEKKADELITNKVNEIGKQEGKSPRKNSDKKQNGPFSSQVSMTNDFTSGAIIFEDNFASETVGNMASKWTSNGTGKIATVDGFSGKWLQLIDKNTYKIKNSMGLPENFTIELDVMVLDEGNKEVALDFGFDYKKGANEHYFLGYRNPVNIEASYRFNTFNFTSNELDERKQSSINANMSYFVNDIMKLKIWVNGEQMKVFVGDNKILDTEMTNPNTKKYFYIATEIEKNNAQVYISNIKITEI